jgi:AAA domain
MPPRRGTARRGAQTARQGRDNPLSMIETEVEVHVESMDTYSPSKNILIHGPSGNGKTLLAGGAPNSVFLSTEEGGPISAKLAGSKSGLIAAPDWEHAVAGVKYAESNMGPEDWLIVDSGTRMQMLYMRWILATIQANNPQRDLDIPAIQDHQKYQNGFMRWYDRIVNAQFNSIFITTSMTVEDAEGETRVIPHILGKRGEISDYISAQASVGLYYAVARESTGSNGPVIRRALAQPYPPYFAKDRFSALGKRWDVEEGDYTAMAAMIEAMDRALSGNGNATRRTRAATRPRRTAA